MRLKTVFLMFVGSILLSLPLFAKNPYEYLYRNLPFEMPKIQPPSFKNNVVRIEDYGGKGDGKTLNTEAFKRAIDELSVKGGGKLIVSAGIWYTGPIVLKSNINLHLEKGALILFSKDFDLYPLVDTYFEGLATKRCQSPISGRNIENVAITGEGSINGSGEAWRPLKKSKVTASEWKKVVNSGGVVKDGNYWFPSEKSYKGYSISDMNVPRAKLTDEEWLEIKDFLRPVMVSFIQCKNVYLQGVLFENSPSWNIHPCMCENIIVDNIIDRNPDYAQNGDGIDVESCKNVIIVNSYFDVGDDAICIKSGKDEEGRRRGIPTENLIVHNCKVFKAHGGFVVGSEMSGGVRNVFVNCCQFLGTDVGLRFKSTRGRGGVVENIYVDGIYMFDIVTDSFLFDLYYGGKSATEALEEGNENQKESVLMPVTEETPVFRNIFVKNIVSRNAHRAMFFNGLPEMKINNIQVENAFITATYGAELNNSKDIVFKNIYVEPTIGPALRLSRIENFKAENFTYPEKLENAIEMKGEENKNIIISNIQLK